MIVIGAHNRTGRSATACFASWLIFRRGLWLWALCILILCISLGLHYYINTARAVQYGTCCCYRSYGACTVATRSKVYRYAQHNTLVSDLCCRAPGGFCLCLCPVSRDTSYHRTWQNTQYRSVAYCRSHFDPFMTITTLEVEVGVEEA